MRHMAHRQITIYVECLMFGYKYLYLLPVLPDTCTRGRGKVLEQTGGANVCARNKKERLFSFLGILGSEWRKIRIDHPDPSLFQYFTLTASTRKRMTFVKQLLLHTPKSWGSGRFFCPYAITVVFTNVMRLRVLPTHTGTIPIYKRFPPFKQRQAAGGKKVTCGIL